MGRGPERRRVGTGGPAVLLGAALLLLAAGAAAAPPQREPAARPGGAKPDAKPGDAKPGDAKPGDAKPGDFAAVLKQALTGRKFTRAPGPDQAAAAALFERLTRGDYGVPALEPVVNLAALDRVVHVACPALKVPSELVKDSTPFLLTGQFDAKAIPPGASISVSRPAFVKLEAFLVYTITLTGARIAPAPIVEARGIALADCHASGDALSLVDGTTTDATITGQGLVMVGGEPVWVITGRRERQIGITLQPLDRRLKNYQVDDGWKFLSAP